MLTGLPVLNANSVPDGFGGLIVTANQTCLPGQTVSMSITDLDPTSGLPVWQVTAAPFWNTSGTALVYCFPEAPQMAIRGDGTVFIAAIGNTAGLPEFTSVDGQTGHVRDYSIPPSTITNNATGQVVDVYSVIGPPIVDSSGTAYVEYQVRNVTGTRVTSAAVYLLPIPTDHIASAILLASTTNDESLLPGHIIPDGNGGIVATWTVSPSNPPSPQFPYQAAHVVSGAVAVTYNLPFSPATLKYGTYPSLVLGENGTAFATDGADKNNGPKVVSFDLTSGVTNWSYQATRQDTLSIIAATNGGGVTAKSAINGVLRFGSTGSSNGDTWSAGLSNVSYYANGFWLTMGAQL